MAFLDLAAERGVTWPLRTERLALRPFTADDAEVAWGFWARPEIVQWTRQRLAGPDALADLWLASGGYLLAELPGGEVVGNVGIDVRNAFAHAELAEEARGREGELSWALHPAHQGKGYATEMVAAALDLVLTRLSVHRVEARCFALNEPSWRLMERLGMRRETHRVKAGLHRDFGWADSYIYAILAEEWCVDGRRREDPNRSVGPA